MGHLFSLLAALPSVGAASLLLMLSACGVDKGIVQKAAEPQAQSEQGPKVESSKAQQQAIEVLKEEVQEYLESTPEYHFPELTFIIEVKDAPTAVAKIEEASGSIVYDPNFGEGSAIPFLVVNLPAEKYLDEGFIKSIGFVAGSLSSKSFKPLQAATSQPSQPEAPLPERPSPSSGVSSGPSSGGTVVFVPTEDIQIPELRARVPGKGLGEGVTVAVIDTGIDASHPIFQDRVIFWDDATEESRQMVSEVKTEDGKFKLTVLGKEKTYELPNPLKNGEKIYAGVIAEKTMTAQRSFSARLRGEEGMDLNRNQKGDDEFLVVMSSVEEVEGSLSAYIDLNGNGKWEANEVSERLVDFNEWRNNPAVRAAANTTGFVKFPARNRKREYAFLIEKNKEGGPVAIRLGFDFEDHGTHVAGIIGGKDSQIEGAAPKAQFMALKVCFEITCTDDAIVRGLLSAFYNPYQIVPDVVNISLGSNQSYRFHILDRVISDLASKFGATFVISASNDGPGYRSINGLGSGAPSIHVGAHVSRKTRMSHYHLDPSVKTEDHHLLFFSSHGPSFTGELRPHVVAPGSALSSTALVNDRSSMFNGTSMSAPITSGGIAALLSVMKEEPVWIEWQKIRDAKVKSVQNRSPVVGSLVSMPLAIRTALENSALRLPNLTLAQQGYGLVQIAKAYDELKALAQKVVTKESDLFVLSLGGDSKAGRLFNRNEIPNPVRAVSIDLRADAERTDAEIFMLRNTPMTVTLKQVEVQAPNGKVTVLKDSSLFALGSPGASGQKLKVATILPPVLSKAQAYLLRNLSEMKEGYTYLAVLEVEQRGVRVGTIVDLIQKEYELSPTPKEILVPGIRADRQKKPYAIGFSNVVLDPLEMHRYPVRVTNEDSAITVEAGLSQGSEGAAWVSVYDPDGYPVAQELLVYSKEFPSQSPIVSVEVPTWRKKGLYEVTIAAGHRTVMGFARYDLQISATRFATLQRRVDLKTQKANSNQVRTSATVSAVSSGIGDQIQAATLGPILGAQYISDYKVIPQRMTYRALKLPKPIEKTDVVIERGPLLTDAEGGEYFFGRIDHRLYVLDENKKPKVVATADRLSSTPHKVIFKGVSFSEGQKVFMAIETILVDRSYPEHDTRPNFSEIDIQITYPDLVLFPGASSLAARPEGRPGLSQVTLTAPETLETSNGGTAARVVGSTVLTLVSRQGLSLQIPVRIWE